MSGLIWLDFLTSAEFVIIVLERAQRTFLDSWGAHLEFGRIGLEIQMVMGLGVGVSF